MASVLYCPDRVSLNNKRQLFLAGPVRGASLWRKTAITRLGTELPDDVLIFSPERPGDVPGKRYSAAKKGEQIEWELDHLDSSARRHQFGAWMFWLPLQSEDAHGHPYGQRTASELGMAAELRRSESLRVVIGAEDGYSGLFSIMKTFNRHGDLPELVCYQTLGSTLAATIDLF